MSSTAIRPNRVVVWGNCQAAPVADLLRAPLAQLGLEVMTLPPVYLLSPSEVAEVHAAMADTALLLSQPIRDEYRVPGCSTQRLADLLPGEGRLVTYPLVYYSGTLPYQVTANGADGVRVSAPLTEYHDLRLLLAAAHSSSVVDVVAGWPTRAGENALIAHAKTSRAELHRREEACDVPVSDLVSDPTSMFTLNHPNNRVLAELAKRVLAHIGADELADLVSSPEREYLGAIRTPIEGPGGPVAGDASGASAWTIAGRSVGWDVVITGHLEWYRTRPDVVADGLARNADRIARLGLAPS